MKLLLPSLVDPTVLLNPHITADNFSAAVSTLRFGTTYKATERNRYSNTLEELKKIKFLTPPIILEVGASDGIASLQVFGSIPYKKYYLTDLNLDVYLKKFGKKYYFFDSSNNCILIVTKFFIFYPEYNFLPYLLKVIINNHLKRVFNSKSEMQQIRLINPEIRSKKTDLVIKKYDMFERWPYEKVDVVIAANILNRSYFSDENIIRVVKNIISALRPEGKLIIIENRDREKSTIFNCADNKIWINRDINGGSDIKELIINSWRT